MSGSKHYGPLEWQRLQESRQKAQQLAERAARLREEAEAPARRISSKETSPERSPEERPTTAAPQPPSPELGHPMMRQAQQASASADGEEEFQRMLAQTISPLQRMLAAVDDAARYQGTHYYERYNVRYRRLEDGEEPRPSADGEEPATPPGYRRLEDGEEPEAAQATPPQSPPSPTAEPSVSNNPSAQPNISSVEPSQTVSSDPSVEPTQTVGPSYRVGPTYHLQ